MKRSLDAGGFFWRVMVLCERLTFASADISHSYKRVLSRHRDRPRTHETRSVFVVRSGPNLSRVRSFPADEKWKNGRKFLVAYVGVIGRKMGLDLLLQAVKHILRTTFS